MVDTHMYTVYILKSKKFKKSYVGYTNDLQRRLDQHNSGQSEFTSKYGPWDLIYSEEYNLQTDALLREKYFKTKQGRKFLKKLFESK